MTTQQLEDELLERWADAAATTYNRRRAALLSFFGWCVERGYLPANLVQDVSVTMAHGVVRSA